MSRPVSERALVFLIGAVQFVNVLDFVMVMPLGPDFAKGLGIAPSQLGTLGGSYTAAASVAGLAGSYFLDRFDRRRALAVAMLGLGLGTAAGGFATGFGTLLAARVAAGLFGGPATSLAISIVGDLVPVERRGRALGAVMGAFSVASVVGVPLALKAAEVGGWRLPFFAVAGLGLLLVAAAIVYLPPVRGHLEGAAASRVPMRALLSERVVQLSYLMTASVMAAGFVLIPNLSAYLQQNLGYPRERLWLLYFLGGLGSFVTLRVAGRAVDRFGSFRVGAVACGVLVAVVYVGFVTGPGALPVPAFFVLFMLALGGRNVAHSTLASRVPDNAVRARFLSLQSSIQHLASAAGAFLSSQLLHDRPDGTLGGVALMAFITMGLTLLAPLLMRAVERRVRERERRALPPRLAPAAPSEG